MKTKNRCNADNFLNIGVDKSGTKEEIEDAKKMAEEIREYFRQFLPKSDSCHTCGKTLGGILGTFSEGLTHGHGMCSNCGHPAVFIHEIENIATFRMILQLPKREE